MKRIFVWIFIIHFATGYNPVAELMRLPLLIEHYKIHRQTDGPLSFSRYLWLHYCDSTHQQSDGRHADLPMHCTFKPLSATILPQCPVFVWMPEATLSGMKQKMPLKDDLFCPSLFSGGVFRPPIA